MHKNGSNIVQGYKFFIAAQPVFNVGLILKIGSGALPRKILLVKIIESIKSDVYFRAGWFK